MGSPPPCNAPMTDATGSFLQAVLGTAGHIDHGKSSLVKALTGTDPDRFREERERGMTIDIGFAEYRTPTGVDVGLVDVPGHERFVRNMVAGASGMDMVMLVVAADDGVMPQTREHLEIMGLLGLQRGFVVVTKIDMVDGELVDLVEEEVREFVEGTFLEGAPVLRCSSTTGEGLDAVRERIDAMAADLPARDLSGVFRMPIQRSFTLKGLGTVVTGIPVSGEVRAGDALEVLPAGRACRVRGVQVHHRTAESGGTGHRTALNISDVSYREVHRGDVIAVPGFFGSSALIEARFGLLPSARSPLRNDTPIRFHAGCCEVMGRVVLLDRKQLAPGEDAYIQVRLEEPVVVVPGDRYLLRLASPERTLGGGTVLGETRYRFKRFRDWINENLAGKESSLGDRTRYLEYVVRSEGLHPVPTDRLALMVKEQEAVVRANLDVLRAEGSVIDLPGVRQVLHADMVRRGSEELQKALLAMHEADHSPFGFSVQGIASRMNHPPEVAGVFLEHARATGKVETEGGLHRLKAFKGGLSNEDRRLTGAIESAVRDGGFAPPNPGTISERLGKSRTRVDNILTLLQGWGRVVRLDENAWLHREHVAEARERLVAQLQEQGEMPSSAMKDLIGATRKFAIPLLEHFDARGITERRDNARVLAEGWEAALEAERARERERSETDAP